MAKASKLAYVFERFPTYTQTFCVREVLQVIEDGHDPVIFSIRDTSDETVENCPAWLRERVHVLPPEKQLIEKIKQLKEHRQLPQSVVLILRHWRDRPDKARVYEAAYIGHQLRKLGGGTSISVRHAHSHFAGVGTRTLWWLHKIHGVGYSFTGHANDLFCPPSDLAIPDLGKLVGDATFVATVSDHSGNWLRSRFPNDAKKVHRVFNGLNLSAFPPPASGTAKGIGSGLIVSIGRLIEKKGFADLISACALLRDRGVDCRCTIVGEGPLEDQLLQLIDELDLADSVNLAGTKSSEQIVRLLLDQAHVFALPCVIEADGGMDNLPTVLMEAMAAALPCVSTKLAGVPEMVIDGETGLLCEPGDVEATANSIEKLLTEPDLAAKMGQAGRTRAEQHFALPRTAGALGQHFSRATSPLNKLLRKRAAKVRDKDFDLVRFMGSA